MPGVMNQVSRRKLLALAGNPNPGLSARNNSFYLQIYAES